MFCGVIVTSGFGNSVVVITNFGVGLLLGNSVVSSMVVGALVTNVGGWTLGCIDSGKSVGDILNSSFGAGLVVNVAGWTLGRFVSPENIYII